MTDSKHRKNTKEVDTMSHVIHHLDYDTRQRDALLVTEFTRLC